MNTDKKNPLLEVLLKDRYISQDKLSELARESKKSGQDIIELIEEKKVVTDEEMAKAKAKAYGLPHIDLFGKIVRGEILNIISQDLAENYKMVAFEKQDNQVRVALVNPNNFKALEAVEFIARKNKYKIKYFVVSEGGFKYLLKQYASLAREVEEALKGAETVYGDAKLEVKEEGLEEVVRKAPVSKMVAVILRHAVEGRASDVHIEPVANETRVRYRIDGVLHTSIVLPKHVHPSVVARIKVLANMKIDETRVPQDGRFRMNINGKDIDYRVSTLPLMDNEKVVMRILDTSARVFKLEDLGFVGRNQEVIIKNTKKSHGMVLVTGPTGSGKSTTLHAILSGLNKEGVNIVTLEDPVEYFISGVSQSQINPEVGLTFSRGLRAILRQDPDIIMVGEIRDNETAELAIHAALTGHLVFSTLHTNDAFGAIPRLIDMKIEPFLASSALMVVVAQRLTRRVCEKCREEIDLPHDLEQEVLKELGNISPQHIPKDISLERGELRFYKGKGCARCENEGYTGRVAIVEVVEVTDKLQKIINSGNKPEEVRKEFLRQGMLTIKQDGILKALQGITTIEEVLSKTKE